MDPEDRCFYFQDHLPLGAAQVLSLPLLPGVTQHPWFTIVDGQCGE